MQTVFDPTPHEEAIALIKGKALVTRAVFDGLLPELRARAFTITGVEGANVMQRVRDAIATVPQGVPWDEAKAGIVDELAPFLGDGAEKRAELLLRTHGFQAFQAANVRVAMEDEDTTHLQYLATEDSHVRAAHLALNGLILPKDDPFWEKHTPPWEWGCRCRVRPMNPDFVEEARAEDEKRPPGTKLVMEGAELRKLNEGTLIRGKDSFDVSAPSDTNEPNAYQWHPDNLRLPLAELEKRYDPEVWQAFKTHAESNEVATGVSVWEWLRGGEVAKSAEPPAGHVALKDFKILRESEKAWLVQTKEGEAWVPKSVATHDGGKMIVPEWVEKKFAPQTSAIAPTHVVEMEKAYRLTVDVSRPDGEPESATIFIPKSQVKEIRKSAKGDHEIVIPNWLREAKEREYSETHGGAGFTFSLLW